MKTGILIAIIFIGILFFVVYENYKMENRFKSIRTFEIPKENICNLYCMEGVYKLETNFTLSECLVICGEK